MKKITPDSPLSHSKDLVAENIKKLKQIFPDVFTEGNNIDFDALETVLGEYKETETERYQFTWSGKAQAKREAQKVSTGTLHPCPEESVDWDTTQNLYIEGDNLEVLKLLQKSYHNKVKMIYIDPPYNTGNDFVYKDYYKDNLQHYLDMTGQKDEEGKKISTNSEASGRYHSNWLNMMYPRIKLARNLLKEDGVIYISINHDEVENLTKLCHEIFGEENYITTIANVNNPKGRSDDKYIATSHEYILVYKKGDLTFYGWEPGEHITKRYNKKDSNGKYREIDLRKTGDNDRREDRPNLFYYFYYNKNTEDILISKERQTQPEYIEISPTREDGSDGNWRWEINSSMEKLSLLVPKYMSVRKKWCIFVKDYFTSDKRVKPTSSWTQKFANSERGTEQFIELGFIKQIFTNPKPVGMLSAILEMTVLNDDLVLDFFAGSSTTAHAIMQFNLLNKQNIKYILNQLPEPTDEKSEAYNEGFKNIADIGKERIRRAAKKIREKLKETEKKQHGELGFENTNSKDIDLGFKVFKLDSSNIRSWDTETKDLEQSLWDSVNNIKEDRSQENVLYEILLKYGLDLTLPIEEHTLAGNKVFSIGYGALIVCLSDNITLKTVEEIGKLKNTLNPEICRVVIKDNGFPDDVAKTNAMQILKRFSIEEVVSI